MQDYKDQILDEPELPKPPKVPSNLKALGIPLGFAVGVTTNFMLLACIDSIRFAGNEFVPFLIMTLILVSVSSALYLMFSLYKFFSSRFLLLNGILSQMTSMIIYLRTIEMETWNEVLDKPHLFSYPALSILILEVFILLSWIMIIKQKKRTLGIILLILITAIGISIK